MRQAPTSQRTDRRSDWRCITSVVLAMRIHCLTATIPLRSITAASIRHTSGVHATTASIELLFESPRQVTVNTQSTAVFEWRLRQNVSNFAFLFLSQKNPQTLMYAENGEVVKENTRFKHRIEIINDDYVTVGFNLTNITAADMGIYSILCTFRTCCWIRKRC